MVVKATPNPRGSARPNPPPHLCLCPLGLPSLVSCGGLTPNPKQEGHAGEGGQAQNPQP